MSLSVLLTGYLAGVSGLASFPTLPDELLYRRPEPEAWSAAEVIHHLADAEISWSVLYRRVLVENQPPFADWDEQLYCQGLLYRERPLDHAVGAVTALRHANVDLLAAIGRQHWSRTAIHPEQGAMTLRELVLMATQAMSDRLAQARRAVNGSA